MNIDAYVFKKPHISLSKLIPNEFIFKAYKSFTYREFPEPNSFKPKTLNEFFKKIKSIKFKKNKKLDVKLSSFYNYPYKKKPTLRDILLLVKDNKDFDSELVSSHQKEYFLNNLRSIEIFKGRFTEIAFIKKK